MLEARNIVGAAAALAIVGASIAGAMFVSSPKVRAGTVEITQTEDRSWSVEIQAVDTANDGKSTAMAKVR